MIFQMLKLRFLKKFKKKRQNPYLNEPISDGQFELLTNQRPSGGNNDQLTRVMTYVRVWHIVCLKKGRGLFLISQSTMSVAKVNVLWTFEPFFYEIDRECSNIV
jgi:hypothetical protein